MTTKLLADLLLQERTYNPFHSYDVRAVFLLNLIRLMSTVVDDKMVADARDAMSENFRDRHIIADLLQGHLPDAVMDAQHGLAIDDNKTTYTKERLIAFLRPDPCMTVEVQKVEAPADPPVEVYQVVIEDGRGGVWHDTFATEEQLNAYLRGIQVTFAMSSLQKLLPNFVGEPLDRRFGRRGFAKPGLQFTEQSCIQHLT